MQNIKAASFTTQYSETFPLRNYLVTAKEVIGVNKDIGVA